MDQRYPIFLKNIHDSICSETPEGIITYAGPQMSRFGYSPEELLSRNFIEFIAPEQCREVIQIWKGGAGQ